MGKPRRLSPATLSKLARERAARSMGLNCRHGGAREHKGEEVQVACRVPQLRDSEL